MDVNVPIASSPMRLVRIFALILCTLLAVGSCAGAVVGLFNSPAPAWFFVAFEIVTAVAGAMGFVAVRRAPRAGTALALLCVAGCAAAGGVLGYLGAGKQLMGVSLAPHVYARVAIGVALAFVAAVEVLRFNVRESSLLLVKGAVLLVPVVAVVLAWYRGMGQAWIASLSGNVRTLGAVFGFLVVVTLLCAGVHFTIRAFERALAKADAELPLEPPAKQA